MSLNGITRDASIQRFEYIFETVWKFLKQYLFIRKGIDCNSPKSCFREAFKNGLFSEGDTDLCIIMCDDRNLTSHTYIGQLSKLIYKRLPQYRVVMDRLIGKMEHSGKI